MSPWFSFLGTFIFLVISSSGMALNINHVLQTPKFILPAWTCLLNSSQIHQIAYSTSSNDGKQTSHLYILMYSKRMIFPSIHFPILLVFQSHNLGVILDSFYSLKHHIQLISKSPQPLKLANRYLLYLDCSSLLTGFSTLTLALPCSYSLVSNSFKIKVRSCNTSI